MWKLEFAILDMITSDKQLDKLSAVSQADQQTDDVAHIQHESCSLETVFVCP